MDIIRRNLRVLTTGQAESEMATPQRQVVQPSPYVEAAPPEQPQAPLVQRSSNSGGAFDEAKHADTYANTFGKFREYTKRYGQ